MNRRPARRVALLAAAGVENYGNDETLDAAIAGVRGAALRAGVEVQIRLVCSNAEAVEARWGLPTSALHDSRSPGRVASSRLRLVRNASRVPRTLTRLARAIRDLRRVDLLCIAGTGTLDDQHVGPTDLPLDVAVWSIASRMARTDLVFASVGAGPIDQRASKLLYRTAVRCARRVSYRDQRSKDYMRGVGRNVDRDTVVPDLAFGRGDVVREAVADGASRPCVAVGVLWSGHWPSTEARAAYFDRMSDVVRGLWRAGFDVSLIEGDVHDRDAVAELAVRLGAEAADSGRLRVPHIRSFDDVLAALTGCAVAVVSRYHNLVAAFLVGCPVVSLEYGFKNTALMGDFGLDNFCHRIGDFVPADIVEHARELSRDGTFAERCERTVKEMRRAVDEQWDQLIG